MAGFVAGPWQLGNVHGNYQYIDAPEWGAFCKVVIRFEGYDENDPRGEATAQLIKSAPDLIKALEWVADELQQLRGDAQKMRVRALSMQAALRGTIARAKGESP